MPVTLRSRRDLNRERTRSALFEAALVMLETEGPDALTAERIADAAGVSRRTFFNYFAGVDALVAAGAQEVLAEVSDVLAKRPVDESLVDSVLAAIDQVITVDVLSASTRVWRAVDQSPAATRFALEAVATQNEQLAHAWARERLTRTGVQPDSLRESIVMATLQVAFDEARRQWLRVHDGPVDAAALEEFLSIVHRACEMVRSVAENPSDF